MGRPRDSHYSALRQITRVANSALSLRRICNSIAQSAAVAVQANGCRILSLNPQKEYLITVGAHGLSDLYLKKALLTSIKASRISLMAKWYLLPMLPKMKEFNIPK